MLFRGRLAYRTYGTFSLGFRIRSASLGVSVRVVRVVHQKPSAAVHLGEARERVAAIVEQIREEPVVVAVSGRRRRASSARHALLREHAHGRALVRARDAVRGVHVAVASHAQVRL
jgi:hypothetical protein